MATDNIRVYLVIDAGATRTQNQWNLLKNAVANKPMVLVVRQKAQLSNQPHNAFNAQRFSVNPTDRYLWVEFEVDIQYVDELQAICDTQCAARSIVQVGYQAKFQALIQAELREAGTDLGFSAAIVNLLTVTVVGFGSRQNAIAQSVANMITNCVQWGDC